MKSFCLGGREGNSLAQKQPKTQSERLPREGGQDLCGGAHSDAGTRGSSPHSPHDLQWPSKHPAAKESSLQQGAKARKGIPLGHRPKGRPSAEGGDCSGHSVRTVSTGRRCSESSSAEVTTATNPKPSPAPTPPPQQNRTCEHFTSFSPAEAGMEAKVSPCFHTGCELRVAVTFLNGYFKRKQTEE